jgi:hypothetical protein
MLERWHEAETPHVVDRGVVAHASETDCHSDTAPTHLHQLPGQDHEAGTCALLALHQIAAPGLTPVSAVARIIHVTLHDPAITAEPRSDLLLAFAPKTSPPAFA